MRKILLTVLTMFLCATFISAQSTTGRIVGTVSAPDGVVPGATVVVTDNQTGKTRTVVSSGDGTYEVPQLEFGTYTVRVTASGYKGFTANDVKVDAGREYSLNALLEVGAVTEEVTVTAGADQINTSNAELSTTISQEQIRELPLNGRNPLSLLNLIAGANPTTSSINGQRSSSTDYRRDGLNVQDNFIRTGGFVSDQPTVDDTSEFTATTQNAGVEQGGGSSLVQLVTPRGGSDYHGSLYIFNRNSEFAANSFLNNSTNIGRPFLNRNQFGGSFSGPLPLPGFGEGTPAFIKDKGFFFFNYEGFRLAQQVTATGTTLLTPARNGTFTYINSAGQPSTINVLTGANFSTPLTAAQGGVLGVDPIIQSRILNNLPTSANGIATGTNFLQATSFLRSDPLERNSFTTRVDLDFNDRNTFNAVYRRNNQADARTDTAAGFSPVPFVYQGGPTNFFAAAYRLTPNSRFSNEIRAGFQYSEPFFTESGIPNDYLLALPLVTNPEASFRSQGRNTDYRNIQDNAVYTIGNHSFRFGGQAEFYKIESINLLGITPTYSITTTANVNTPGLTAQQVCGSATCISATELAQANSLRYLLGGIIGAGSRTSNLASLQEGYGFGPNIQKVNYDIYSAYGSDQWRIKPNLTLNLGLRYELYTPLNTPVPIYLEPIITNGDLAASIRNPNGALGIIGGNVGKEGDFTNPDKDNFAPSISFNYSPQFESGLFSKLVGDSTVIRGGFRINYINDEYVKSPLTLLAANRGLGGVNIQAFDATGSPNVRASLSPIAGFSPLPQFTTLPTLPTLPITYAQYNTTNGAGNQLFGIDPDIQLGRVYEWNIGIQRNIGLKTVLEVRYVGNKSNDLVRTTNFDEIDIRNNGFLDDFRRAQGNLSGYDAEFNRRRNACIAAGGNATTCTNQTTTALGARSAAFSALVPGSQQLTVFPRFANNVINTLTNATFLQAIAQGEAGRTAQLVVTNRLRGNVQFQQNPNIFLSEIVTNAARQNYNALQVEVRRRFANGFSFQANYTFQKTLTDVPDDGQNRQGELQESANPDLNYGRPDYDRTHTVNANMILELPFGRGKRFLNQGGLVNLIFGGFQFSSIVNLSSGPPLAIIDPRGTSSIAFVSGRQSARSSLTADQLKGITGVFDTPNGRFFVDPSVLFALGSNGQRLDLNQPLPAGVSIVSIRATSGIGQAPFDGQVFFFNNAGETGNLPRNFLNGLPYINWDASLSKNIRFSESMRLQLRMEAFNVLNAQVPYFGADLDINSNNFGRICAPGATCSYNTPRIIQFGARFDF